MRRALTYSLLFAGVFLATVWIRLAQRDDPAPAAAAEERVDAAATRPPAAALTPVAAPSGAPVVTPAADAPADEDPRDAIAGDVYPAAEQFGVAPGAPAPGPHLPDVQPSAPPAPPPFDPAANAQRDEIAGDVYPGAPGNAEPDNVP
jgi:hypothetical protein